jgi:hypothetical protein
MEFKIQSVLDDMPEEVKNWVNKMSTCENFSELRMELDNYLFNLEYNSREALKARLENSHCKKCNKLGCIVELRHVGGPEKGIKMLCNECFNSI